jgi:hypothetical protein
MFSVHVAADVVLVSVDASRSCLDRSEKPDRFAAPTIDPFGLRTQRGVWGGRSS